jgi:transposase
MSATTGRSPIAIEAVERIDALFAVERDINGMPPPERVRVRHERSRPLVTDLEIWLRQRRAKLSGKSETGVSVR